jgi:hypothetical protein
VHEGEQKVAKWERTEAKTSASPIFEDITLLEEALKAFHSEAPLPEVKVEVHVNPTIDTGTSMDLNFSSTALLFPIYCRTFSICSWQYMPNKPKKMGDKNLVIM